jgi:hypothetical protein
MADMTGGNMRNIGGVRRTHEAGRIDPANKQLSIADLNMLVMLERSDILDKQIRDQVGMVKTKNEQMKMLGQIQSKLTNQRNKTQAVNETTWAVNNDKNPKEITLDNGYKIQIHGSSESWSIIDAKGNSTKIWGDPHVNEEHQAGGKPNVSP